MKTIIYRPSVENTTSYETGQLEKAFATMELVDKTVCDDRVIYVFKDKEKLK
jgi:hypothetical protein